MALTSRNKRTLKKIKALQANYSRFDNKELAGQVIKLYELWDRAMRGEWWLYFKYFAYTTDEHEKNKDIRNMKPLVNDKSDEEWMKPLISEIMKNDYDALHINKSRQQRVSWIMIHVHLYEGLANNNWLIMLQSTKRTNKGDELYEKQKKAYDRLPPWKPKMTWNIRDGKASVDNQTKYIMLGKDVDDSASFTFNRFFFDEMALHAHSKKIIGVCLAGLGVGHDSGAKMRTVSTPRMNSYFVEMAMDEVIESTREWLIKREWSGNGLSVARNKRNHKVISLHYSANSKKDQEWKDRESINHEDDVWEREFELNPDAVEGDKVFKVFDLNMVRENLTVDCRLPLLRGWDFGNKAGVSWLQYNPQIKKLRIIRELVQEYSDSPRLCREVNKMTKEMIPRAFGSYILDICDPYAGPQTKFEQGGSTMFQVEQDMYDHCRELIRFKTPPRRTVEQRLEISRVVIKQGFEIDRSCNVLIKGFRGGYVLKNYSVKPKKDGIHDNIMDSWMYVAIQLFDIHYGKGLVFIPHGLKPLVPHTRGLVPTKDEHIEGLEVYEKGVLVSK